MVRTLLLGPAMRRFLLIMLVPACVFFTGDDDDDECLDRPAIAPAPLRNPETLRCESYGGGCDPSCGPCPAVALEPIPSWGECGSTCEALNEGACMDNAGCRVVKDARCAVGQTCLTDFLGCFP